MSHLFNSIKNLAGSYIQKDSYETRGESSREMRFNVSPPVGTVKGRRNSGSTIVTDGTNSSSDFNQWLHAMKMVARLPGGMPPEFRRKLWLALADKYLKSKNVDWEKEEIKCFSEQWREDDEELGIQIVKDLHRTGSSLCSGPAGTLNQAKLKRILLGYARYNPEVGYCQGFNMLGALILQVMDKEEIESIKVMIYLVEGILPSGYFSGSLGGLQADMAVFRELMTSKLPRLARHLQKLQGPVENAFEPPLTNVFTMQWFLTMFCTCLPMTCVLRVWDLVLIEGSDVLLRTALVLWSLLEDRILETRTADDFYCKMGSFSSELLNGHLIDSNGLIEKVVDLGPILELQKLRDKHLYNISPFRDKKGLKLYYSDDEGDSDEDSRMAVATAWGLRLNRRGSASLTNKTDGKERIALDISLLKKQYDRLRERQRQAHIILTSAVARQGSNANQPSIQMNQLLIGRNAIVTNNGRRLGPPQGAIPPARKPSLPTTKSPKPSQSKTLRSGETLHWRDTEFSKRRRGSLKWKDIKPDSSQSGQDETTSQMIESTPSSRSSSSEPKSQKSSLKARQRSDSSSYSEDSDGNSSTSTSLCDEDDQENCDFKMSSLEGSPFKKAKLSKKHSEVPHKKCLEDVLNSNEKHHIIDSQIPFIQLTTMNSPVLNANKTDIDSPDYVKEYSETESNRLDYAGFVDEYNWPDIDEAPSIACNNAIIGVTSDERDFLSISNDVTSSNQLSPLPDIAAFLSNSDVSPLRSPITSFDYANLVTNIDDSKKFDVNDEGVTNEYFERINIVERPTKLDLLYSLNDEDSIRNAYNSPKYNNKNDGDENVSSECSKSLTNEQNTIIYSNTEETDRKMKVLLEYSNKSSLSFIAEAKQEISDGIFKEKSLRSKPFIAASVDNEPSNDTNAAVDKDIEEQFLKSPSKNIIHPAVSSKEQSQNISLNYDLEIKLKSETEKKTPESKNNLNEDTYAVTESTSFLETDFESRSETEFENKVELIDRERDLYKAESFEFIIGKGAISLDQNKDQNKDISGFDILSLKTNKTAENMVSHIPSTEDLEIRFRALESNFSEKNKTISIDVSQEETETSQTYLINSQGVSDFSLAGKHMKFDYSNKLPHNFLAFPPAGHTGEQEIPELDINSTTALKKENSVDNQDNDLTEIVLPPNTENDQRDLSQSVTLSEQVISLDKPLNDEKPCELIDGQLDRENDLRSKIQKEFVERDKTNIPGKGINLSQLHHVDEFQPNISLSEKPASPNKTRFQLKENNFKKDEFEAQDKVSLQSESKILESIDTTLDKENNIEACTKYLVISPLSYSQDHFGDKKTLVVPLLEDAVDSKSDDFLIDNKKIGNVVTKNDSSDAMQLNVSDDTTNYVTKSQLPTDFNSKTHTSSSSETSIFQPPVLSYTEDHFGEEPITQISLEDLVIDQHSEIVCSTKPFPKTLQNSESIDTNENIRKIKSKSNALLSENKKKILPVKSKIPSTEDLESRFMALERQFSEKTVNLSQINLKGISDQPGIKQEKQEKEPSHTICPISKNIKAEIENIIPPNTENRNTTINLEISNEELKAVTHKVIPTTADLEHRFKELERKLSSSNVNSSSKSDIPQQTESTQSNKVMGVKSNNEAIAPKGSTDNLTDKSFTEYNSLTDSDQPPFIRKRIPSTEDLETRFKALEIEKSFKSPTSTSSNLLSPSAIKGELETDAETRRKSEIPSTKDLENRFQALERNKLAQKLNKETPNVIIKTEATGVSSKHIVLNFEGLEQRKIMPVHGNNLTDSPDNLNANASIELTEQEGKSIPSTKDLETRFDALEQQKLFNSEARKSKTNDLGYTIIKTVPSLNKQQDKKPQSTENLQTNLKITPNSSSENVTNTSKSDSINNHSDPSDNGSDVLSSQPLESNVKITDKSLENKLHGENCSIDNLESKVNNGSAIGMQVIPFNNKPAVIKIHNLDDSHNDCRNDTDYHKPKDLYKLESQSDDTITMADPSSVEFEAKTESRPASCPEYSDPFDTNSVTTDRVLKIIEENSKILHRILKKTLADTGGKEVNAQFKKSHPAITDSLLVLGNIFPPAQCNETISPSRIKSQSWIRPTITLRSDDNISDRLASIKSTIKSIDTLCEEKSFRKDKCQRYIDSLFARPTKTTVNPAIKVDDIECTPSQERISKREFKKDTSPRRRRNEDREENESRVRRDMMPNSLDAPSSISVSIEDLQQVDSEVDRINHEKQSDSHINQPLSPYYGSQYDLNKRSITPVVYIPTKLEIRHTTVTSTFYDRYLTEKQIERTFPRNKKSPLSPTMTKSYLDILNYPSPDITDRSSKSAENSPSRQKDGEMMTLSANKKNLIPKLEVAEKDLHIRSCDNILLQLRSSTHNKDAMVPSIMVYNPLPAKIRKPAELGISLGLYKNFSNDETSKS